MITTLREITDLVFKLLKKKRLMKMNRMTNRLRDLVWTIFCEGIDHPNVHEYYRLTYGVGYSNEEIDFCIEWMKNKLGV
jgi:hypothetical protein